MRKQWLVLLVTVLVSTALWGCGNGGSGSSSSVTTLADVAVVGIDNCTTCHESYAQTQAWLGSTAHGNVNGRPDFGYYGNDPADCQTCHDPAADGALLAMAFRLSTQANRPVIGCESCHGGGSAHRGVGPLPFPKPTEEQCASCHQVDVDHHPVLTVADDFDNSAHKNSLNEHIYADDSPAEVRARCAKCHTDEGARKYRLIAGDHDELVTAFAGAANLTGTSRMTCRTCHTPHQEEVPLLAADEVFTGSGEYNTCSNCHQLTYPAAHAVNPDGWMKDTYHAPPVNQYGEYGEIISDTHYDDPATSSVVEGYVVLNAEVNACSACHNLHNNDNTINNQWARSAHSGFIAEAKEMAEASAGDVFAAGTTDLPWTDFNWDTLYEDDGVTPKDNGAECQECHTATGAMNYLNDPAAYDFSNNDFSHLSGWTPTTGSPQQEVLYCWGCHNDAASGDLRNPGPIPRSYSVAGTQVTLPDLGNSNVCANCHGARGNMEGYAELQEDPTTDFSSYNSGYGGPGIVSVTNAHYLAASATLLAADTRIGYEYSAPVGALLDYTAVPYFAHDAIGLNAASPETGSGPCAGCHMTTAEAHTFEVVGKDASGVITGLNSTACITCHDGSHGAALEVGSATAAAFLEAEAEGYHEALAILLAAVEAKGIAWTGDYPYFDTDGSLGHGGTAGSWINEGVFGAAHNYNYLHHEPGAYAHNRIYAKRLIFDSIDWLDNYTLEGSIAVDATAYPEAAHWLGADTTTGLASRP